MHPLNESASGCDLCQTAGSAPVMEHSEAATAFHPQDKCQLFLLSEFDTTGDQNVSADWSVYKPLQDVNKKSQE